MRFTGINQEKRFYENLYAINTVIISRQRNHQKYSRALEFELRKVQLNDKVPVRIGVFHQYDKKQLADQLAEEGILVDTSDDPRYLRDLLAQCTKAQIEKLAEKREISKIALRRTYRINEFTEA